MTVIQVLICCPDQDSDSGTNEILTPFRFVTIPFPKEMNTWAALEILMPIAYMCKNITASSYQLSDYATYQLDQVSGLI